MSYLIELWQDVFFCCDKRKQTRCGISLIDGLRYRRKKKKMVKIDKDEYSERVIKKGEKEGALNYVRLK